MTTAIAHNSEHVIKCDTDNVIKLNSNAIKSKLCELNEHILAMNADNARILNEINMRISELICDTNHVTEVNSTRIDNNTKVLPAINCKIIKCDTDHTTEVNSNDIKDSLRLLNSHVIKCDISNYL